MRIATSTVTKLVSPVKVVGSLPSQGSLIPKCGISPGHVLREVPEVGARSRWADTREGVNGSTQALQLAVEASLAHDVKNVGHGETSRQKRTRRTAPEDGREIRRFPFLAVCAAPAALRWSCAAWTPRACWPTQRLCRTESPGTLVVLTAGVCALKARTVVRQRFTASTTTG
jgi:hypothetical protein